MWLYSVHLADNNTGWAVGEGGTILKTTDGGIDWNSQISGATERLLSVHFTNNNTGWIVGWSGTILKTTDGGTNWNFQTSGSTSRLYSVHFTDQNTGWAVGGRGTILKTTNGGVTSVEDENSFNQPKDFLLSQNYPNPFNPTTIIKYQIPEISFVTIKIYDVLGNEIASVVNEEKSEGSYEVEFDGKKLTSGIYFYRLQADTYVETRKMVLIK